MKINSLLLDTHTWLWLVNGDTTLTKKARTLINDAANTANIYLSTISVWEVCMLEAKKRITLGASCQNWIKQALERTGIQLLPLSPEVSIESCQLPGKFHEDPADKMIVATARVHNLHLVTRDHKIIEYSKKQYVNAIKC